MTRLASPSGGRTVPEWIGKHPDQKVPPAVRLRVFDRAGGICHISGRRIAAGEAWQLEHIVPLSMGGEHRESNLAPALVAPHQKKSAEEAHQRAKERRVRSKHLGIDKPRSRGLRKPDGMVYDWQRGRYVKETEI